MVIQVTIKNVYGNETIYPACDTARKFTTLVGRKTLTSHDIRHIKDLGYTVEIQSPKFL